eukprot:646079-Amphidinium_carterae.1
MHISHMIRRDPNQQKLTQTIDGWMVLTIVDSYSYVLGVPMMTGREAIVLGCIRDFGSQFAFVGDIARASSV